MAAAHGIHGHEKIDLEQLLEWDPEFLVVPCYVGDCGKFSTEFASRPGIAGTHAAREGRLLAIPASMLFATGRAMLALTEAIHQGITDAGSPRNPTR